MKAYLKNYRQAPRKVRLVADMVRGQAVDRALAELKFLPKRASGAVAKVISSAAANAENNFKVAPQDLVIKEIMVDKGITLKRFQPKARGMAHRIDKHCSNIRVVLGTREQK